MKKDKKKKPKVWIKPDPHGKFRHQIEYNKKGRHPYKRETNLNLEDYEDEYDQDTYSK